MTESAQSLGQKVIQQYMLHSNTSSIPYDSHCVIGHVIYSLA